MWLLVAEEQVKIKRVKARETAILVARDLREFNSFELIVCIVVC